VGSKFRTATGIYVRFDEAFIFVGGVPATPILRRKIIRGMRNRHAAVGEQTSIALGFFSTALTGEVAGDRLVSFYLLGDTSDVRGKFVGGARAWSKFQCGRFWKCCYHFT